MKHVEHLSWLLAAENEPAVRNEAAYAEACSVLESDAELQTAFAEEKAFLERHPLLVGLGELSAERKADMQHRLEQAWRAASPSHNRIPWFYARVTAWAALLVLLLGGLSLLATRVSERSLGDANYAAIPPSYQGFQQFAAHVVDNPIRLAHRDDNPIQLVNWLQTQGAGPMSLPGCLQKCPSLGCKVYTWHNGSVSMICMKLDEQTVHLFVTENQLLRGDSETFPGKKLLRGRHARTWADERNAYLLIAHDEDVELPDISI